MNDQSTTADGECSFQKAVHKSYELAKDYKALHNKKNNGT